MNDVHALLTRCRELGAELTPTPYGTLKVKARVPLPDTLRDELKQRKAKVITLLASNRPYIKERAELLIPFNAAPRYHWWAGGQSILDTLRELGAPPDVVARYVDSDSTLQRMQ
jgi:hypothetical protein